MRMSIFIAVFLLLAGCSSHLSQAQAEEPTRNKSQPNVVLIISDDHHYGDYSFMGSDIIQTPRLDQLATESLLFRRGYVSTSLCGPSLASMVTGLYPRHSGITGNLINPLKKQQEIYIDFLRDSPLIPQILGEHGYLSLQTGKWWHGHYSNGGFTHGMSHGDVSRGGRHGDEGLVIGREGMDPIPAFIDEAKAEDKPFFIWYAPFLPHTPHTPPERLFNKYKDKVDSPHIARYYAMCEWFDESCGELLDLLDDKGVAEDTIILFIGDNGWINHANAQRYAPRSKRSPYDGGLRTPIMVKWPGHVEPAESDGIASNLDLLPTILDACGIDIPERADGVSLLKPENQKRDSFTGAVFSHDAVDMHDPEANLMYRWRIEGQWKLIEPNEDRVADQGNEVDAKITKPALYNILEDPEEQNDVAANHPEVVERMKKQIAEWW